jgi:predicted dehydrogenase
MFEAFNSCVKSGAPVPVSGADGMRGLAIVEAAFESARTGRIIATPIEEDLH